MKKILTCCSLFALLLACGLQAQNSTIVVTRTGTNAQIDDAIDYTMAIWEHHLHSSVDIKVNLIYTPMTTFGPLAITIPNGEKDFAGAPMANTWYPTCLANAITSSELNPGEFDMDIYFNADFSWYFGIDGNTPFSRYDFVTVLLHEVAHGLGIATLAEVDAQSGEGSLTLMDSLSLSPIVTSFPFPNLQGEPAIFSQFVENGQGQSIVDTALFPNPSLALAGEFTGNDLWFTGANAFVANGSANPKLYAPGTFNSGSSTMHLNEASYPLSSGNSCMTPFISSGDAEHDPGPLLLAILQDIGWTIDLTTAIGERELHLTEARFFPNPFSDRAYLAFELTMPAEVSIEVLDVQGKVVYAFKENYPAGPHHVPVDADLLQGDGLYFYRMDAGGEVSTGKMLLRK